MRATAIVPLAAAAAAWLLTGSAPARAQQPNLGHKLPGTVGLFAGRQPPPGVYFGYRFGAYAANEVVDRTGRVIPVGGVDIDAYANAIGISVLLALPGAAPTLSFSIAAPVVRLSIDTSLPEASVDRHGFGDVYVEPVRLGWRWTRLELLVSYAFYAPTGHFEPRQLGGIGRGQWTHQPALGTTVYFDAARRVYVSALLSYNANHEKRGIDLTRGDTLDLQGGVGLRLFGLLDLGLAAYGLWQVRDDRGSAVPPALRGARAQAFGLGPEVNVAIARRAQLGVRYVQDVAARTRPVGRVLIAGLTIALWRPAVPDRQRAGAP